MNIFKIKLLKKMDRILGPLLVRLLPGPLVPESSAEINVEKILFVRPGGIGDAVLLIPALQSFKKQFPDAVIDVLAEKRNAEVFRLCPAVNRVLRYDQGDLLSVLFSSYAIVVDTEQWYRFSAVVCRLVHSKIKIGFGTNSRSNLLTHSVAYDLNRYEILSFQDLVSPLGIQEIEPGAHEWLVVPVGAQKKAVDLLAPLGQKPFLVVFAGASIPEKRWAVENFCVLVDWCLAKGLAVVVVGSASDAETNAAIADGREVLNLTGKTSLAETAAVLARAVCVVSGDSGVLHLAAGLDCPTVALFGPSNPRKWAPLGPRHIVLETAPPCSPCSKFGYTPPCSKHFRCLAELTPERVCQAVAQLIIPSNVNG